MSDAQNTNVEMSTTPSMVQILPFKDIKAKDVLDQLTREKMKARNRNFARPSPSRNRSTNRDSFVSYTPSSKSKAIIRTSGKEKAPASSFVDSMRKSSLLETSHE